MASICIIGMGYKPLDSRAKEAVLNSGVILASGRLFEILKKYEEFEAVKEKVEVINNVDATMNFLKIHLGRAGHGPAVILASGDPLFCGIGRRTLAEFGKDMVEIIPDLSSLQIAFARIREPWDDAFLMSLHPGPAGAGARDPKYRMKDIPSLLREHEKIGVLTDSENNPARIAEEILRSDIIRYPRSAVRIYVCERLGYLEEKITEGSAKDIATMEFREPNVVIILRCACSK